MLKEVLKEGNRTKRKKVEEEEKLKEARRWRRKG